MKVPHFEEWWKLERDGGAFLLEGFLVERRILEESGVLYKNGSWHARLPLVDGKVVGNCIVDDWHHNTYVLWLPYGFPEHALQLGDDAVAIPIKSDDGGKYMLISCRRQEISIEGVKLVFGVFDCYTVVEDRFRIPWLVE